MWLERKGFVEKSALEKIRSEINANSTRIETYFRNALETSIAVSVQVCVGVCDVKLNQFVRSRE